MGGRKSKLTGNRSITIALFGLDDAGKTTAARVLERTPVIPVVPTIGFAQYEVTHSNEKIKLFDLGGAKQFRDAWRHYYDDIHGVIYVVDSSNHERLDESRQVLKELLQDEKIKNKPILILANKQDEETAADKNTILKNLDLKSFANNDRNLCRVELCTAKLPNANETNSRVDPAIRRGFDWLIKAVCENYTVLHKRIQHDVQKRNEEQEKAKIERKIAVQKIREERAKQEDDEDGDPTTNGFVPIGQAIKNAELKSKVTNNVNGEM